MQLARACFARARWTRRRPCRIICKTTDAANRVPSSPAVKLYEVLGEERPHPRLRDPDPYAPCGREKAALPVAVAAVGALGAALAAGRPARPVGLRRHERVQGDLQAPAPERLQVGALLQRLERERLRFRAVA